MSRRKVPEQGFYPYHLTARTVNKEWFSIPQAVVWRIFEEQLFFLDMAFGFEIHAFVLMNNHFHLIATTPQENLSEGMRWFMKETSRYINYESHRDNQVWGGRFYRSLLSSDIYFLHCYKYVYRNPVKDGLVADVFNYPYSSLRGVVGFQSLNFPVHDTTLFDMGLERLESWLNQAPCDDDWAVVKKAVKKTIFKLAKVQGKEHPLEMALF